MPAHETGLANCGKSTRSDILIGKRVVFTSPGSVEIETFDVPRPGPLDVLVETEVSLISPGTEGASLLALPNTGTEFPQYPGYSNVGRVLEVGGEVEGIKPGDRFSSHGAHASHLVIQSLPEHSVRRGTLDGIDPSSSRQTLRRAALVPDGLGSDTAAFANLCAISLQGVRKARIELGESVLVIGQGLVGNLAAQFARLDGGYPVIAADLSESRLSVSRAVGADHTILAGSDSGSIVEAVRSITKEDGARAVIETTGAPDPVVTAFKAAGWHGRVVLLASTRGETERVNFYADVHRKALTILGAHNSARPAKDASPGFWPLGDDLKLSLDLMAAGRLAIEPLITTRVSFEEAAQAYRFVTEQRRDALGILLEWK